MHYISYISIVERVSCLNPLYPLGLPPSDISICAMEATASYLELPNASVNRPVVDLVLLTQAEAQSPWSHPMKILHEPKNAILIRLPQPEPPTNDEKVASAAVLQTLGS